jgi:putative SOS response-associated peptidase YedK
MCARFSLAVSADVLASFFGLGPGFTDGWAMRWNIAPSQDVPVVLGGDGERPRLAPLRWGFVPAWLKADKAEGARAGAKMINARAESAHDKPAFRQAMRHRRCLVPTTGFYEWTTLGGAKHPLIFRPARGPMLAMAGIWSEWTPMASKQGGLFGTATPATVCTFSILTTGANATVAPVHHRMPVLLAPDDHERWLDPLCVEPEELRPLLRPAAPDFLVVERLSPRLNDPRREGEALWQPGLPMEG